MSELDELLPADAGLSPLPGVAVGVVTSNADPEHLGRVKVRFPALSETVESAWAPVMTPMAGSERGLQMLPEAGDTVVVAFEQGDVNRPFVLGGFWTAAQHPPEGDSPGNAVRLIRSRSGHVIRLDDSDGAERIEIADKTGNNLVTIDSAKNAITVQAAGPVTVAADGDLALKAKGDLTLEGRQVKVTANLKLALSGQQGAELTSTGPLAVRGSVVDIN
ncbi:MAG: phage baseplate assembly protein V [Blastococcus sp.]